MQRGSVTGFVLRAMLRLGAIGVLLIVPSLQDQGQLVIGGRVSSVDSVNLKVILVDLGQQTSSPVLNSDIYFEGVPSISSDGNYVAFISSEGRLQIFDIDDGQMRDVNPDEREMCCPSWSPDGQQVAFMSAYDYPVDRNRATRTLYIVSADGSELHEVTTVAGLNVAYTSPQWSPDGQHIGFLANEAFYNVEPATGDIQVLDQYRYPLCCFEWSPNGRYIAFNYFTSEGSPLYIVEVATEELNQYPELGYDYMVWSASSRYIAVVDDREYGLAIIDTANGEVHEFDDFGWYSSPAWSPNADEIAFLAYQGDSFDDLYTGNPDGTTQRLVVNDFVQPNNEQTPLQWSPDGNRIAAFSPSYDRSQVAVANVDGTGFHVMSVDRYEEAYFLAWRP